MADTPNLGLPDILASQAQKHVTHNESLRVLDVVVQLSIKDRDLTAPPGSPANGDRYIVGASATGDWAGEDGNVAAYQDGVWAFYTPNEGWLSWVDDENILLKYDGASWSEFVGSLNLTQLADGTVTQLGVNTASDTTNRLSVSSDAVLFTRATDDIQVKLNKQASTDTASFLYQTNFSGRAEIGTIGDDDFTFKVSPDGSTWYNGIIIDKDTGEVTFPNTTIAGSAPADNILIGAQFATNPFQRGTSFDSTTTPANNDDTYLADRWVLISDGNDIVDVAKGSDNSLACTVQTANKQFGFVQIAEASNCDAIIGNSVSIAANLLASGLATFRMAVLSWTGTADSVTSDVVGTWAGGGAEPTWATNWTREGAIADITTTGSYATTKGENIAIDTASTKQVALVIWLDDTDGAVSDTVNIKWLSMVAGDTHPDTPAFRSAALERTLCKRYYEQRDYANSGMIGTGVCYSSSSVFWILDYDTKRVAPTVTVPSSVQPLIADLNLPTGSTTSTASVISDRNARIDSVSTSGYVAGNASYVHATGASSVKIDAEL